MFACNSANLKEKPINLFDLFELLYSKIAKEIIKFNF